MLNAVPTFALGAMALMARKESPCARLNRVCRFQEEVEVFLAGSVHAASIPNVGKDPGLVEDSPGLDAVSQSLGDDLGIVRESASSVAVGPAAFIFKGLR
jgi:hypothetical protein